MMWTKIVFFLCLLLPSSDCQTRRFRFATRCTTIQCAARLPFGRGTYFFSKDEYIKYDNSLGAEKQVRPISKIGLISAPNAAVTFPDASLYVFKDCTFNRYNVSRIPFVLINNGSTETLGLPCNLDAATNWEHSPHVFKDCNIYRYNANSTTFQLDGTLSSKGLPCQLDAALEWTYSSVIFIKGKNLWQVTGQQVEGPRHTDSLNICSWYICDEADWMLRRPANNATLACNGDKRLCPLRLNQVTMPGLHNAGAGFAGGFGLLSCWMRNHGKNITDQLRRGIRHLDIDPCFDICGSLGTCHAFSCGGSICAMIKQIREFLKEFQNDVITLNFNHEIKDKSKVFKALTRQLNVQLLPLVNNRYRISRNWPTLSQSIRSNKRVFVIFAPDIEDSPYYERYYVRNKWIHSERLYASTWRPFTLAEGCAPMVNLTARRCAVHQRRALLEVSVVPETRGSCTWDMAKRCKPFIGDMLRACQTYKFIHNSSPNVVLVDWPETGSDDVTSVFNAVKHQNLRNIMVHRQGECSVKVDAAVHITNTSRSVFFTGPLVLDYDHNTGTQSGSRALSLIWQNSVSAAYFDDVTQNIVIYQGCETIHLDPVTLNPVSEGHTQDGCVDIDAAVIWDGRLHTFRGCSIDIAGTAGISLSQWGLPCHIDAALVYDGTLYVIQGNNYYEKTLGNQASLAGQILDWNIDVVQCL